MDRYADQMGGHGQIRVSGEKKEITMHVCGGKQLHRCVDGGEHDMTAVVRFKDGGSVACAKCGITAMEIDLWEAP